MAKNLKPCITIINIDGKEARLTYDQMREHLFNNPELWQEGKAERRKIGGGKKKDAAPVAEVEMEKYVPLTAKNIEIGKFSKDEALDYYEDEKELDSGRMSTYISSMTVDVMDENGDSVGNLIKLKDEDGIVTYQATDVDGNDLTVDEFDTKQEAVDAILAAHNKVKEKEFVKEQKRLAKAKEKAEGKQLSPEQKLKQAFNEWKAENNKLGISVNWEKLAESDKKLIKALFDYIKEKIREGAYSFETFAKEYGGKIKNFDAQRKKWEGLYNKAAKEVEAEKPVTPTEEKKEAPEGKKPVRELPEAPEGQVVKAVLGRSYQATTSEKVAEAMNKSGLFREVRNLDEAFEAGRKFVDELGWDGAYEVFQDLSATVDKGILLPEDTRMGIFNALTEDLQKRIDNPVSVEQQANDAILMAEVMAKGGELVSRGAYRMRVFQEILKRNTVPYQYEKRIKEWKALFPDSEVTKELEDKLKAAEEKYNNIHKKFIELSEKQRQWEESQAVSDIKEGIESEKKAAKKPIASALKKQAERVRKMGLSRPGFFSAATPASIVWDAAVETVALTLEAGGSVEIAIKKAIQGIKDSKWYKDLSDKNKKKAEASFVGHYADLIEEGVGMVEVVKGNIVVPHNLIRYYVAEGMTDINEIADAILDGLSEKYPDLTQREVRDAITGYARKVKSKTADEINDAINTLKREGKLRSQLEDLQNGIVKEKSPKLKKVLSERIKNLQKEIDRIHQEMFGHTPRQMSDAERLDAYKKRAAERIKELKEKIANRDFSKKPKRPPVDFDEKANNLAAEKNQLDEEWADLLNEESARQAGITTKVGKFLLSAWGVPRSVVVGIDFGVGAIQAGLSMFNDRKQTAKAFANAWKALRSTENYNRVDAVLKSHPQYLEAKKAGLKFYSPKDPEAFKGDMVSISALQRAWDEFGNTFITEIGPLFGEEKEKQFKNYWKAINPLAALERSQAGLINTLNFGMYLRGADIAEQRGYNYKTDPKVYDQIANVANTLSRKATIGGLEKNQTFMNTMNALWFSAQNWVSLLKLTSPLAFWYLGSKRAGADKFYQLSPSQQVAAEIMVKAAGTYLSTLLLIKFLTGWEDPDMDDEERKRRRVTTVNMTDPRRADYLKVRMPEQTIDPFAGLTQEVILTYRLLQHYLGNRGYVSTKTGIESYLGENNVPSPLGLIGMQAEGKLSPSSRFAYRYIGSRPIKGQPSNIRKMYMSSEEINMEEEFKDLYTNLTYETAKDQFTDYNVLPAAFLSLLGAYGYGFTREERMEEKSISKQIRETTQKGKEYRTYEKAFKNYAKDGDEELAKKVFEKTLGGKSKEAKSIEMIKEISEDGVSDRYKFGLEAKEDMPKFFELLKTGIPIKGRTAKQTSRLNKINELPKEQLDRIKSDYKVQYDEVMSAIKVLNTLGVKAKGGKPIDYDYKIKDIPWVKAYRKTMLEAK